MLYLFGHAYWTGRPIQKKQKTNMFSVTPLIVKGLLNINILTLKEREENLETKWEIKKAVIWFVPGLSQLNA